MSGRAVRRRRPPALDVREWREFLIAALNEIEVPIGGEFVIVHGDDYEADLPANTVGGGSPRRVFGEAEGAARATDPATSKAAARDVTIPSGSQRYRLLVAIVNAGSHGLTSEEASDLARVSFSRSSGPRIAELKRGGFIRVTGRTREGSLGSAQDVLVATDEGRKAVGAGPSPELSLFPEGAAS